MQIGTDFDIWHHFKFINQFNESNGRPRPEQGV